MRKWKFQFINKILNVENDQDEKEKKSSKSITSLVLGAHFE